MRPSSLLHLALALATPDLPAIEGGNPVFVTAPDGQPTGWKTFELLTGNDPLGPRAAGGFAWNSTTHAEWDGLGAYRVDDTTLRVLLNHEVEPEGSVSRLDFDIPALIAWIEAGTANNSPTAQVPPPLPVITSISQAWTQTGDAAGPVNSPCSGNAWTADTFGPGRGFHDPVYLFAQEFPGGTFRIIDLVTRTLYQIPDLGTGRWENAVPIDTGRSDTMALVLSEDFKSDSNRLAPMRLYVGSKNPLGGFLARNGLVGGTIYHWTPEGTSSTDATTSGLFSGGNGTSITGIWRVSDMGAALFSNCEDLHPNMETGSPGFGRETVQACEGQGVFLVDFTQLTFDSGLLGSQRNSKVTLLYQSGSQASDDVFSEMDNLTWAGDGLVYVCEDSPTGDVWQLDPASLLTSYDGGDFTPDSSQVLQILAAAPNDESSGIIEISEFVYYEPGSVFLVNGKSSNLSKNQLALIVSPGAAPLTQRLAYSATPGGSLTGRPHQTIPFGQNGTTVTAVPAVGRAFLGWSDGLSSPSRTEVSVTSTFEVTALFANSGYLTWIDSFGTLTGLTRAPDLDPDQDSLTNLVEYAFNLDPARPHSGTLPAIKRNPVTGLLEYEFLRRIDNPELSVVVEASETLEEGSWVTATADRTTPVSTTFERIIIGVKPGVRFFRLRIQLANE